jgi:L-ascorbate metabolism protein UlaG (beta-lactamase superfamily)
MIEPILRDEAFLADVARARAEASSFHVWWIGQSGFLIQWQGRHLLLDPYLSDSLTRKYAQTDKPHVRMTRRVIAPDRLNFIDLVTSSHNHTDHLDGETLGPLLRANPNLKLIAPEANRDFIAERLGIAPSQPIGLDAGQSAALAGFTLTGVPAAHETIEKDAQGRCRFLGYVIQFGGWTLYHSGDTIWEDAILAALAPWRLDLMFLPINGRHPSRGVAGNLNGREAARFAKMAGTQLVIPCHYEMFEFNTARPDEFIQAATDLGQPYRVLRAGERWSSRAQAGSAVGRGNSIQKRLP